MRVLLNKQLNKTRWGGTEHKSTEQKRENFQGLVRGQTGLETLEETPTYRPDGWHSLHVDDMQWKQSLNLIKVFFLKLT